MSGGYIEEPMKKSVCWLVLNQVMSQDACRLVGTCQAETACPQMRDEIAERRFLSNETAAACPGNEIDMDIRLYDPGHRLRSASWLRSRDPGETGSPENRQETIIEAVPRWRQDQ